MPTSKYVYCDATQMLTHSIVYFLYQSKWYNVDVGYLKGDQDCCSLKT